MGALDLTALGVGAIIGTGIFVVIGEVAGEAGPAVTVSFVLAALTCLFSALSYAELASSIPIAGSAYTYAYATLGEVVAWIIGWDLVLEYGISVAAVAVGWGANLNSFLDTAFGGGQRGLDHLLRLHRLRRGLHRQRGGQAAQPRPAPSPSAARC